MKMYVEISISASESQRELLIPTMVELGCQGFEERERHLLCFMEKSAWESQKLRTDLLGLLRTISANAEISVREFQEENWNAAWEASIKPIEVGSRLVIKPSWADYAGAAGRLVLQIDPKMSFGTGYHETTRLTLRLLEEHLRPGDRMIDVGTGTGILAIAGVLLGAADAEAIDIDEWSIDNARENIDANGLTGRVTISDAPVASFSGGRFTLLAANLTLNTNLELLGEFQRILAPGGRALFSGLLKHDEEPMIDGLRSNNFKVLGQLYENEWVAIVAEKPV
jgi:ribosomal protein L11 methyltransferase